MELAFFCFAHAIQHQKRFPLDGVAHLFSNTADVIAAGEMQEGFLRDTKNSNLARSVHNFINS